MELPYIRNCGFRLKGLIVIAFVLVVSQLLAQPKQNLQIYGAVHYLGNFDTDNIGYFADLQFNILESKTVFPSLGFNYTSLNKNIGVGESVWHSYLFINAGINVRLLDSENFSLKASVLPGFYYLLNNDRAQLDPKFEANSGFLGIKARLLFMKPISKMVSIIIIPGVEFTLDSSSKEYRFYSIGAGFAINFN